MPESTVSTISSLEHRRYEAMLAGDVAALDGLLDDGLVYTHSNGALDTKSSYLEAMRAGRLVYRTAQRSDEQVLDHGDAAIVTGRVRMSVLIDGEERDVDSRFTLIYVRKAGRWLFAAWQSTPARA